MQRVGNISEKCLKCVIYKTWELMKSPAQEYINMNLMFLTEVIKHFNLESKECAVFKL